MKVDKNFYLASIYGGFVTGVALFVAFGVQVFATIKNNPNSPPDISPMAVLMCLLAGASIFYASIMSMVLLYKAWQSIQDGQARTTPGKAVGFMFIPLFNLYWIFQAIYGFAVDYNKYTQRHNIAA